MWGAIQQTKWRKHCKNMDPSGLAQLVTTMEQDLEALGRHERRGNLEAFNELYGKLTIAQRVLNSRAR